MVTSRHPHTIAVFVAVVCLIALAFLLPQRAKGAEPDRDRAARVALAIAATRPTSPPTKSAACRDRDARVACALAAAEPAVALAPMPHPKAVCPCAGNCKCAPGVCPACPAATAPPTSAKRLVGYERVCIDGTCYWIPVYEP